MVSSIFPHQSSNHCSRFVANLPKVGSKLDKASLRAVTCEEGLALANKHGSQFCEASAKTRETVRKPFVDIVGRIARSPYLMESASSKGRGDLIVRGATLESSGCSC